MLLHKDSSAGTKGSDNGTESSFFLLPPKNPCIWMGTNGLVACKPSMIALSTKITAETCALCN